MTAAEYQALANQARAETLEYQGRADQHTLTGLVFGQPACNTPPHRQAPPDGPGPVQDHRHKGHTMNARDELSEVVLHHPWLPDHEGLYTGLCPSCPDRQITGGHNSPNHADHLADAILADGYRKPRTITTFTELLEAANDVTVIDNYGAVMQLKPSETDGPFGQWFIPGEPGGLPYCSVALPATVLHEPDAS